MNPFNWIRRWAKEAFLEGITDGLREITPAEGEPPAGFGELAARLGTADAPALPTAEAEAPAKGRGKKAA